jgi:AcrR family transcriptional regulator
LSDKKEPMAASESDTRARGALGRHGPTKKFEAKRNVIVRSAVEQINRRGVRGMTLGSVAADLGLVPTAVIYYFKSKEDLATEVFSRGIARFEAMIAAAADAGPPAARVTAFVQAYFADKRHVACGEADPLVVFNDVRALNAGPVNEAYVEMFRHARALLEGKETLPRLHRNARAHLLLSQMFWIIAWLHRVDVDDYERTAERMARILNGGLVAKGAAWPTPSTIVLTTPEEPGGALSTEMFLRAATQLINEEGYHGASVDRISARLNVSKGAFYHHNETKDELVTACFQRTFDITWRAIRAAEAVGGTGLDMLVAVASALIEHQMGGQAPLLRTSALTTVPEAIHDQLIHDLDRITWRFASIVSDGIADGSIAPVDVNQAAEMITGAINAAAELHHWAPGLTPQTVVDHYVRPLFMGLSEPVPN